MESGLCTSVQRKANFSFVSSLHLPFTKFPMAMVWKSLFRTDCCIIPVVLKCVIVCLLPWRKVVVIGLQYPNGLIVKLSKIICLFSSSLMTPSPLMMYSRYECGICSYGDRDS